LGWPDPEDYDDDNDDAASHVDLEGEGVVKVPLAATANAPASANVNAAMPNSAVQNAEVDKILAQQATAALQESAELDVAAAAAAPAVAAAAPVETSKAAEETIKPGDVKLLRKLLVKGQLPTALETHLNIVRPLVIMEHLHAFGALGKDTTADAVYARHLNMLIKRLPTNAPILVLLKRELQLLKHAIDNAERIESLAPEVQAAIKAGAQRSGLAIGPEHNPFGTNRGSSSSVNGKLKKEQDTKTVHATLTYYLADNRDWRAAYMVYYKLWIGFLGALNDGEFDSCNQDLVEARAAAMVLMTAMADRLGGADASSDMVVKDAGTASANGKPLTILQRSRALFGKIGIASAGIRNMAAVGATAGAAAVIGILTLGSQFKRAAGQLHQQWQGRKRTEAAFLSSMGNQGYAAQNALAGVPARSPPKAPVVQAATSGTNRGFTGRALAKLFRRSPSPSPSPQAGGSTRARARAARRRRTSRR
jgi:hypothetical protein